MKNYLKRHGVWFAFLVLAVIIGGLSHGDLFSPRNISNLLRQISVNGILASGMTVVILTSGIDLSVGSVLALCGVLVGISQFYWGWSNLGVQGAAYSLAWGIFAGMILGTINGALISIIRVAPFVITLGMMVIARGMGLIFSNGSGISPMSDSLVNASQSYLGASFYVPVFVALVLSVLWRSRRNLADSAFPLLALGTAFYAFWFYQGFPTICVFLLVVVGGVYLLLQKTPFGRGVYAIGSNEQAAVWAGVSVRKIKWMVYVLMGSLAGLAGALVTARQNGASPTAGELAELDAIAAVVIGGTSLKGGSGQVIGSLVGALIIGLLNIGMDLLGVTSFYQMVFKGFIIIVAVGLDRAQRDEV